MRSHVELTAWFDVDHLKTESVLEKRLIREFKAFLRTRGNVQVGYRGGYDFDPKVKNLKISSYVERDVEI